MVSPISSLEVSAKDNSVPSKGWYIGIEGGVPFGFSTFSSFAHDKTRLGWAAGLHGGYRFNPVLSAELTAKYGIITLAAQDCCADRGYWLGSDGLRYNAAVLGMDSWNYKDLKSRITLGQYGARLNVNMLGLFHKTRNSRWSLGLSPHLYAVSTKSTIKTLAGGNNVRKNNTKWHMGYGADVQVAYPITHRVQLGVYSGITVLTGSRMDAMPEYLHENNFIWESGLRVGLCLGKGKKKAPVCTMPAPAPAPARTVCPEETKAPTVVKEEKPKNPASKPVVKEKEITFPDIYFRFNGTSVPSAEKQKLQEILDLLKANPDMKVNIKGWCDTNGSKSVNKRYSRKRAQSVRNWLVRNGISAQRINVIGMGSDYNADNAAKARRASTEKQGTN